MATENQQVIVNNVIEGKSMKNCTLKILFFVLLCCMEIAGCADRTSSSEELNLEGNSFSLNDLLIDEHVLLGKCPYWNMDWKTLKEESPAIENVYFDSFPGTPDMFLTYSESEGITYVTDNNYICAVLLTNDTYGLQAGIRVGDEMTQMMVEQYDLKCFEKGPEGNATIMTGMERKSSQKLDYDFIFSGTTFISQEESDAFMEEFLKDITLRKDSFVSNETGIAVSFYVKEGIIVGICMEYIV